eukprot:TRINITY_DN7232_c0_g1_i2.p1 TRINITY_DN7232_c0_g1~~TRINITY_DN7232_c0_g1_i2.p1  ORF type:complete len:1025 (-),score=160.95 TRINITY_DN7232_c0_g1_i2:317-3391(-)
MEAAMATQLPPGSIHSSKVTQLVYDDDTVMLRFGFWVLFWLIANFIAGTCFNGAHKPVDMLVCRATTPKLAYVRRLKRSQVYCMIAVFAGFRLLWRCKQFPEDLLYDFCWEHQLFFTMAVAHWLVSIWEDRQCWTFLSGGLDERSLPWTNQPAEFLLCAYTIHHFVSAGVYIQILRLQRLSAVGIFGLLFEFPVLMLNSREIAMYSGYRYPWMSKLTAVKARWLKIHVAWAIFRGGPILVYLYSVQNWMPQLMALDRLERTTYHCIALFFMVINAAYWKVMVAWSDHDKLVASTKSSDILAFAGNEEAPGVDVVKDNGDEERGDDAMREPLDPDADPLGYVPYDFFLEKTRPKKMGGEPEQYWLEIDGSVYNVANFFDEHPGGVAVLREHIGKDASEAFAQAKHSIKAKVQMVRYLIGPLKRRDTHYRIFEHNETVVEYSGRVGTIFMSVGATLLTSGPWGLASWAIEEDPFVGNVVLALLVVLAMGGMVAFLSPSLNKSLHEMGVRKRFNSAALVLAAALVGYITAMPFTVNMGMFQGAAPGGLEVGAVAILAVEAWRQPVGRGEWNVRARILALLGVPLGWVLRAVYRGSAEAAVEVGRPGIRDDWYESGLLLFLQRVLMAAVLGVSLSVVVRRTQGQGRPMDRGEDCDQPEVVMRIASALRFSAMFSAMALSALWLTCPAVGIQISAIWKTPLIFAVYFLPASGFSFISLLMIFNTSWIYSAVFTSRTVAFWLSTMWGVSCIWSGEGFFADFRWVTHIGFNAHLAILASSNRERMRTATQDGNFATTIRDHIIASTSLWDQFRAAIATFMWKMCILVCQAVINTLLPKELRVYACEIPIFDLGEDVAFGVAAHIAPGSSSSTYPRRRVPEHFVCNVGQMAIDSTTRGLADTQRTMNTLRDVWAEFGQSDMQGLVSNIVCVFPEVEGQSLTKEINLSVWESEKAAYDWYSRSKGHKDIVQQHTSGMLKTFGNLLATLRPSKTLRYQDRCTRCARVVESPRLGDVAPSHCGVCGGKAFQYPLF